MSRVSKLDGGALARPRRRSTLVRAPGWSGEPHSPLIRQPGPMHGTRFREGGAPSVCGAVGGRPQGGFWR